LFGALCLFMSLGSVCPRLQLLTRRNLEFFLPSDAAPAGTAVESQLDALTRRQLDAAKVAEEAERWERVGSRMSETAIPHRLPPAGSAPD
jgi:hypothetical protein